MGIPQHRERIIITASIGKPIYLLKNKKEHTDLQKLLENKPSDAYRMPFDTEQRTYYRDLREM
jgi:site-specific DNA-cytosine methylase